MANAPRKSASQSRKATQRTDLTARRRDKQQAELSEKELEEQARLTTAAAEAQQEKDNTIDDFTGEGVTEEEMREHGVSEVVVQDVEEEGYQPPSDDVVDMTGTQEERDAQPVVETEVITMQNASEIVIPREDCRFMLGAGNIYRFSAGRRAKVPAHVAAHMREKGLIWD